MTRVTRKKNGHLIEITRDDGTHDIKWDWPQLLADVKSAIAIHESSHVHAEVPVKKASSKTTASKKTLVKKSATKK